MPPPWRSLHPTKAGFIRRAGDRAAGKLAERIGREGRMTDEYDPMPDLKDIVMKAVEAE